MNVSPALSRLYPAPSQPTDDYLILTVRLSLADADTCLSRDASSREHAAFALGELCSSVVASETLRPLLLASPSGLALVLDSLAAICEGLEATHAELRYFAVPQFAPLTEAAGSIGQALKALPLGKGKALFLGQFNTYDDHFAKTGSGQTLEKFTTRRFSQELLASRRTRSQAC
jgi:hypothetical protein